MPFVSLSVTLSALFVPVSVSVPPATFALTAAEAGPATAKATATADADKCHSSHEQRKIRYSGANLQTLAAHRSATRLTSQSANTA